MDDLEESITAAIVQKHPPVPEGISPQQFHAQPRPAHATSSQQQPINYNYQQQPMYEQLGMQHSQSLTQMLMEPDSTEDERETGRQTLVRSKEQPRPVQRVPPMQAQQQTPQCENNEAQVSQGPSEQAAEPQSAKMLIFLQNGEQRLITLPNESCTLQEVLEQVNVPFSVDTRIQCMHNTSSEINYFVSIGSTTRIEEMLENHPMLVGDISNRSSPNKFCSTGSRASHSHTKF